MPRNTKQVADADTRFMGIAPRIDPASLPEGMASEARNMRFRNGVAESRKGMYKCPWINNITPEIDSKVRPFGEIHGVGVFRNPKNLEFVIIAADNKVYFTRQNNNPIELTLPTGVTITGTVNFTQAFNKMIMWRGEDFAPLVMSSEDDGFEDLVQQWDSAETFSAGDQVAFGPLAAVDSITHTGGVATVTTNTDHGYLTGADITIAGSSDTEFNGRFEVTVASSTTLTYEVTSSTSPAGGTITCTNNRDYYEAMNPPATALNGELFAPLDTALNGGIDDSTGTTTITVDSTTGYPAAGTILIENEEISYTATTATEFSGGARAQGGTTIAAHADDVAVSFVHDTTITVDSTTGYPAAGTIVVGVEKITYTGLTATTFTGCTRGASSTATAAHADEAAVTSVAVATDAGDSPATQSTRWGDGTTSGNTLGTIMPNSTHGVFIANRVVAPTKYNADPASTAYGNHRQFVAVSDILDHVHTFWNQIFRVNFGTDSEIQDLLVFDEQRLLVFSDKNVSMVTAFITSDVNATLGDSVSIQPVVQRYGVSGRGAAAVVGSDVYFYASRRGIVSLSQTEQSKVRGVDMPLSEPIQPLIDRIDPRNEANIRIAWWNNSLYVACGIDGGGAGGGNNALLVFDFIEQKWASHDTGDAINPAEFFIANYNNSQRLFYVATDGFINLVEENDSGDDLADLTQADGLATTDFESYLLTRGYHTNDIDHREFKTAAVNISTWNPNFTIKAKTDGANESQTLVSNRTKSRFNYYRPFDAAPFLEHNNNADHANPYREDYSVELDVDADTILTEGGDVIIAEDDSELVIEGLVGGFVLGSDGVQFNRFQETLEPFALAPRMGRYTQLELSNTSGRIKINQVTLTNQQGDRTIGVKS